MALMEFIQRFQTLQMHRDTGNELIKDILVYCEKVERDLRDENAQLSKANEDANLDLDDARRSRRDLQQQLSIASQQLKGVKMDYENMKNRNPYIIVLIDGDGMIFKEDLVRQGIEGGKKAAVALRNAVLEQCSHLTDEIEIMAKVCVNMVGLSKAMKRDGSIDHPDELREFALGFTQGKASFDFIDVGHGKERADSKIKECMRWHLRNHNCKQIVLGVSHDAGYAPFLDEVVGPEDRDTITILEGPPTVRELKATGLSILSFGNLFRVEKMIDRLQNISLSTSVDPGNGLSQPTWAGVTTAAPNPANSPLSIKSGVVNISVRESKRSTSAQSLPSWVPEPRGLDPLITVSQTHIEKIRRKVGSEKLCNNHYLRGPCAKGDECCFEHNYKATEDDLKAISYLTRLNPCINGQYCDETSCIYGHHCPSFRVEKRNGEEKGWVCAAFSCRFGEEDHPPGTVIKNPRKWD